MAGLDEDAPFRAARERLESERTRSREEVGDAGAVERAEHVEERLADTVSGRARVVALRHRDPVALLRSRDDPHGHALGRAEVLGLAEQAVDRLGQEALVAERTRHLARSLEQRLILP